MWTYGGVRVFAQEEKDAVNQVIPRLQPIGAGTILQVFGYDEEIKSLSVIVVGKTDKEILKSFTTSGIAFPLVDYDGAVGDYYLKDISFTINATTSMQSIRTDLSCYAPVYLATMELYLE